MKPTDKEDTESNDIRCQNAAARRCDLHEHHCKDSGKQTPQSSVESSVKCST